MWPFIRTLSEPIPPPPEPSLLSSLLPILTTLTTLTGQNDGNSVLAASLSLHSRLSLAHLAIYASYVSAYYCLRHSLLYLLLNHPTNHVLKILSLLFPQVCSLVKEHAERTSSTVAAASIKAASTLTPRFNAKRSSIFMTPSLRSAFAATVLPSPPSAVKEESVS